MGAERAEKQVRDEPQVEDFVPSLAEFAESTRRGGVTEFLTDDSVSRSIAPLTSTGDTRIQPKLEVGADGRPVRARGKRDGRRGHATGRTGLLRFRSAPDG